MHRLTSVTGLPPLQRGRYRARLAVSDTDVAAAQDLRGICFLGGAARDGDGFDAICDHMLVEDARTGALLCCFRFLPLAGGAQVSGCYAAQFYDLSALQRHVGPLVEMGRFCIHPDWHDPDILRLAWGALTAYVDAQGVEMLFGCASFAGTDAAAYGDAFAWMKARHLAPAHWRVGIKAAEVYPYAARLRRRPDARRAMGQMPPLLRTYLAMGGWVSDHAVVDRDLHTLHVFTAVEIATIPPARKQLLRALVV